MAAWVINLRDGPLRNEREIIMIKVYLFADIPGSGKDWTLAVFATSKRDAVNYVKRVDGGGRYIGEVQPGKVDASCGAITDAAQIEMERSRNND